MKKLSSLLILAAVLTSTAAWSACKPPDSPRKFPDGKTAAKADMQNAQKIFADFDKKIETYRACLKEEHEAQVKKYPKADDDLKKQFFEAYQKKDDAALNEAEKAKNDLNAQIAAYNEAARARKAAAAAK